jgi:hypothetical protein
MHRRSRLGLVGAASAAVALSVAAVAPVSARPNPDLASHVHFMPTRAAAALADAGGNGHGKPGGGGGGGTSGTQAGIFYHGGRIASPGSDVFHVVSIYWSAGATYPGGPVPPNGGDATGDGSLDGSLVGKFLGGLGGTPYYNINTTYWDNPGASGDLRYVSGAVKYDRYWADGSNAPSGTQNVSDAAIQAEIVAGFTGGMLTYQADTIYAVFSAGDVNLGGGAFTQYCAYHGHFSYSDNGKDNDVLYAVMPYDDSSSSCKIQSSGPNGDPADAEVNTLAHEIEEANTDPDLNAWWDHRGYENADKCAWKFGTVYQVNGAYANMSFAGHDWLVQQNWRNSGKGSCGLQP